MAKTFNISFPENLLTKVDKLAKTEYRSRSELLREAVVYYISTKDNWQMLQSDLAGRAKLAGIKSEDDVEAMIDENRS